MTLLLAMAAGTRAQGIGSLIDYPDMKSAAIGSAHVTVWLPSDYPRAGVRYGVLYMQDGQNLFDLAPSRLGWPAGKPWGVDSTITALDGRLRPVIVVAVDHMGVQRARQYVPHAVFKRLPEATQKLLASEYGGEPFSDDTLRFLVTELKPFVDRTYQTDSAKGSTFVMGSSMGGLISLYAVAEYPDVFGGAACLSTHWPLGVPGQPVPDRDEVLVAFASYLRDKLKPGHRLWFDHGTATLDATYAPYQHGIDTVLGSIGWRPGPEIQSVTYVDASHDEAAWRARLADPLIFLLGTSGDLAPRP
jgi:enterochelin esterase-like enzyme